ncbi:hypothetical protein DV515_00017858, partial [Chloebia gouldiae]
RYRYRPERWDRWDRCVQVSTGVPQVCPRCVQMSSGVPLVCSGVLQVCSGELRCLQVHPRCVQVSSGVSRCSPGVPRCSPGVSQVCSGVSQVSCPCPIVQEGESRPWKGPAPSRCTLPHPGVPRPIQVFTCPIQVCPTPSRCAVPHPGVHCPIQVFTCPIQVCPPPIQVFIAPSRCSPAPSTSPHLTWGSGVSVQVLLLQFWVPHLPLTWGSGVSFWVPHLSRCAFLGFLYLGLKCRCPGVAAAPLWGPISIFGFHTCPGVQFWSVTVQVLLLHLYGVQSPFLGSTPVWARRYRVLPPGAQVSLLGPTPVQVCSSGVPSPGAQVSHFGVQTPFLGSTPVQVCGFGVSLSRCCCCTFMGSELHFWGPHLPSTWRSGVAEFGVNTCPGVQFWSPLTWGSGVAFWGPISISGVHTCLGSQVPSPSTWGSGDAEFGVHTWLGSPHLELSFGFHTCPGVQFWSVAVQVLMLHLYGVQSPLLGPTPSFHLGLRCCRVWSPHLAGIPSPGAQVLHFGFHTCPGVQFCGSFTWGSGVTFWAPNSTFGAHTCPGSQVPSPSTWGSGDAEFGAQTCAGVQFWGSLTWGSGVSVQVLLLQFRVPHLPLTWGSGVAVQVLLLHLSGVQSPFLGSTPSPHLGLRCHCPGVADAPLWGPISTFGFHTCLGSQVPSPSIWGSGAAEFGAHTCPAVQFWGSFTWGSGVTFWALNFIFGVHTCPGVQFWSPFTCGSGVSFWVPHLSRCAVLRFPHLGLSFGFHTCPGVQFRASLTWAGVRFCGSLTWAGVQFWGSLTWISGVTFWVPQEIFGFHTCLGSQVPTPFSWGSGDAEFWSPHLPLTWGSGVAVQVLLMHLSGVQSPFLGSAPVRAHRYRVLSPGAQVLHFGFHTCPGVQFCDSLTWGSGVSVWVPHLSRCAVLESLHLGLRCLILASTPVQVCSFGVPSPVAQVSHFGFHTCPGVQFCGSVTWGSGVSFWVPQEIFGVYTCLGSQVPSPSTWGSGVAFCVPHLSR